MDNDKYSREEIARAYSAVQKHVLPGLAAAWDDAGPSVVLAMADILADVWLTSEFPVFDLIQVMNERHCKIFSPALYR